jgi:hypothetical protein
MASVSPDSPRMCAGPDLSNHVEFQMYGGRRLSWKDVQEMQQRFMDTMHEPMMRDVLRAAGWIWDKRINEFCYEVTCDYYLGEPERNESGGITPEAFMTWYTDAQKRGILPEELNEETANLIYNSWVIDTFNYRNGSNCEYEYLWNEIDRYVYGDRHISDDELEYYLEKEKVLYDHSDEI